MQIAKKRKTLIIIISLLVLYIVHSIFIGRRDDVKVDLFEKSSGKKFKNWFNKKLYLEDKKRVGPGENGADVKLTDASEITLNDQLYEKTGFSVVVSDKISVNRSLPDVVHADCFNFTYFESLPRTSVIVIFHNEVKSVLLRTVHSIINRTPPELLHEVILVNDNSTSEELYQPLQDYVAKNFPSKVKIKNLDKRCGLIVTRMEGARKATGEVLVFLDSHVEVHFNWLPPLLHPIVENRRIATLPIVDFFDAETFGYLKGQESFQGARGIIDWYLDYHELPKLPADSANDLKPFPNPIMLGCAFAIDRKFFLDELGGYDEGLQIWNGENYELSFKLWMCADGLFTVPCSRVSHSFRSINPSRTRKEDYVARNFKRLAEVWLDEFKDLPRQLEPERYANVDADDLTYVKALRKKLKCKSFRWFLTQIAPDMIREYPPLAVLPSFASGSIQSFANPRLCLDNLGEFSDEKVGLAECSDNLLEPDANQKFIYSFYKDIRQDYGRHEYCLDAYNLNLSPSCNQYDFGNQFWFYDRNSKEISLDGKKKCLTLQLTNDTLTLSECNKEMTQQWIFAYVNQTAFESFETIFGYASILNMK